MAVKKSTKKAAAKKSNYSKSRSSAPKDGTKLILSSYFEVSLDQGAAGAGGVMAYSLRCDPNDMKLKMGTSGNAGTISGSDGAAPILTDHALSFPRLEKFKEVYRQYKIDTVKVSITTDRECGLDNPVIATTDKGDDNLITAVATAMNQAHKQTILTESRRTCNYGWKPSTAAEREYRMTSQAVDLAEQNCIKVLQDVEPKANGVCKHRVNVTVLATLKDSKSPN